MNIQIFGKSKCFDTKKAQRWFKERRIPFQMIDLPRYGMSGREFESVLRAVGGVEALADWSKQDPELDLMRYLERESDRADHLFRTDGPGSDAGRPQRKAGDRWVLPGDLGPVELGGMR